MYKSYESINLQQKRKESANKSSKTPFQHQIEAFTALSKTFKFGNEKPGSGILVLPTGAGKTFTAVRWLSQHVIPKNIKILWLAPSFYLLEQALATFCENATDIPETKQTLNIRCVSSNPAHQNASSIALSDDIVIMTIQTAIKNLHTDAVDKYAIKVETAFKKFVDHSKEKGLFVVVDEAHHAPAHGCRNLLIGEKDSALGLRGLVPGLNLLGLTATPTYTDESKRGWLWKIFTKIIYKADKDKLILQGILAKPNYIQVSTGIEREVDDRLYDRLMKQHKDLPEEIITKIADDSDRNNFIVKTYVSNKDNYGKTIIFADRWFQCVYIKEKLKEHGIKNVDAIYSHIDADPGSAEARNKRTQDDNKRILDEFKTGKLDVLINVRMLTEGADVPNVRTVFLTRQTKSSILMTQMIGRALRGEKVGGSSDANVVLFFDDWKRLIDWADPETGGTKEPDIKPATCYPLEYISIRLIEELSKAIESGGDYPIIYTEICPVGWYKTEIVYADNKDDSTEKVTEFVMVYEDTKSKFESFIDFIKSTKISDEWSKEYLDDEWMRPQVEQWTDKYFERKLDDIGQKLQLDLIKIVRHIAQDENHSAPLYYPFEERELYDLDKIAKTVMEFNATKKHQYLSAEFSKPNTLWQTFYKTLIRLETAVDATIRNILYGHSTEPHPPVIEPPIIVPEELTDEEKIQVKTRDGYVCLCCGENRRAKLQVDHIKPRSMGGVTSIDNSQTLCGVCNRYKSNHEVDFMLKYTPLKNPKKLDLSKEFKDESSQKVIKRIVNWFYHCQAVYQVAWDVYTYTYTIYLYPNNNPEWLLPHKEQILKFVRKNCASHATNINVMTKR